MRITRYSFLLITLVLSASWLYAQDVPVDSTSVEWRSVNPGTLDQLSEDEDLNYPIEAGEGNSFFAKVLLVIATIIQWITDLFRQTDSNSVINIIYFVSTITILYLIWRLFFSKYNWIFSSGKADKGIPYDIENEDIHKIDFEGAISSAVKHKDFRLAVRLVYLRTLKLLSDKDIIHYADGKTNNEYIREVLDKDFRNPFLRLSYHFNYIWYGNFKVDEKRWEAAQQEYQNIENTIKN